MTGMLWLARKVVPQALYRGVRPLGKVLPFSAIRALCGPAVAASSFLDLALAGPTFAAFERLPASFRSHRGRWAWRLALWRQRNRLRMAELVRYWPDDLAAPRWKRLCRFEGPPSSLEVVEAGTRPVILMTLHYGPMLMLYHWLRSRRVRIAALTATDERLRPRYSRRLCDLSDRAAGLEGVPRLFLPHQLRDIAEFLQENGVLLALASGGTGRHLDVEDGDIRIPLGPGVLQLAAIVEAVVIPCSILAGPRGTMTIALGEPLSPDDLRDRKRHRAAFEQFLRFFLPTLRSSPGQSDSWLVGLLRPLDERETAEEHRVLPIGTEDRCPLAEGTPDHRIGNLL